MPDLARLAAEADSADAMLLPREAARRLLPKFVKDGHVELPGAAIERRPGDLPSEPAIPGAVQVPPDGRPIVLGPDAGVTGGYPVLAVLLDLDAIAQARPGQALRFEAA